MKNKKRISIIMAFVVALSMLGIMGAACSVPTTEEINAVTTANVFEAIKNTYKDVTGSDLPPAVADKLNDDLWNKLADGTGYMDYAPYASELILEYTGVEIPPQTLAIAIKAVVLVAGI
ncbi:MAG: hypothetical protein LBS36_04910 [Oscillospiraceae bacterium]|nr:hypothetical protein [Oscillospiraceae bacterium]